jgi:Ca2+-binding RTX toxin-like protein
MGIDAGAGRDVIDGGAGTDQIDGGGGIDRVMNYDSADTHLNVELGLPDGDAEQSPPPGGTAVINPLVVTVSVQSGGIIPVTGGVSMEAGRAIIFRLVETLANGSENLLVQVLVPAWSAPEGTIFTFAGIPAADLPAMQDGSVIVGQGFVLSAEGLATFATPFAIQFVTPADTEPGVELTVAYYDEAAGEWSLMETIQTGAFSASGSTIAGVFALVQVTQP